MGHHEAGTRDSAENPEKTVAPVHSTAYRARRLRRWASVESTWTPLEVLVKEVLDNLSTSGNPAAKPAPHSPAPVPHSAQMDHLQVGPRLQGGSPAGSGKIGGGRRGARDGAERGSSAGRGRVRQG